MPAAFASRAGMSGLAATLVLFGFLLIFVACEPRDCESACSPGDKRPDGDIDLSDQDCGDGDTDSDTENEQSEAEQEEDSETPDAWPPVTPCEHCVKVTYSHRLDPSAPLLDRGEYRVRNTEAEWIMSHGQEYALNELYLVYTLTVTDACAEVCALSTGACYRIWVPGTTNTCYFPAMHEHTVTTLIRRVEESGYEVLHLDLKTLRYTIYIVPGAGSPATTSSLYRNTFVFPVRGTTINVYDFENHMVSEVGGGTVFSRVGFPKIEGEDIFWSGVRYGEDGFFIFRHSLKTGETEKLLPEKSAYKSGPVQHQGVLAWVEDANSLFVRDGKGELYVHELASGKTTLIDPTDYAKDTLSLHQRRLVYTDLRNDGIDSYGNFNNGDIYLYDLKRQWGTPLADRPDSNQFDPLISGRWVVYRDDRWPLPRGGVDLVLFDLCALYVYEDDPMCARTPEWARFWLAK